MAYSFTNLVVPSQAGPLIELADCLCTTVASETGLALCWCGIFPGGIPSWDYCGSCAGDNCGMGYVTMDAASSYTSFGQPAVGPTACATLMQANISVGVLRCMPMEDDGSLPPPDTMSEVAMVLMADMMAMKRAITCCFKGDIILGTYNAAGASGGCVGGQWNAVIGLDY